MGGSRGLGLRAADPLTRAALRARVARELARLRLAQTALAFPRAPRGARERVPGRARVGSQDPPAVARPTGAGHPVETVKSPFFVRVEGGHV